MVPALLRFRAPRRTVPASCGRSAQARDGYDRLCLPPVLARNDANFPTFELRKRGGDVADRWGMTLPRCILAQQTYLVTRRCLGRRFLLRPDDALNNAFLYCLALAADKHGVQVHGLCAMSNHYHLVLTDPKGVLPDFMGWLNRQLAMCVKRLRRWDEVVWEPIVQYSAAGRPSQNGRDRSLCAQG